MKKTEHTRKPVKPDRAPARSQPAERATPTSPPTPNTVRDATPTDDTAPTSQADWRERLHPRRIWPD